MFKPNEMTIKDFVDYFDFDIYYTKNKKGEKIYHLYDNQRANWGDIESDKFSNFSQVIDRLDIYFNDYLENPLYDVLFKIKNEDKNADEAFKEVDENFDYEKVYKLMRKMKKENVEECKGFLNMIYYTLHSNKLKDDTKSKRTFFK